MLAGTPRAFNDANGARPESGVTVDGAGNLYGTTYFGGIADDGVVFEIPKGSNTITMLASFEGAPAGVAPFAITTSPDALLHDVTGGFDILGNDNWNLRFLYTGSFGATTRQDAYSLKIAIPF